MQRTLTITFNRVPTDAVLVFIDARDRLIEEVRPDWARAAPAGRIEIAVPAGAKEIEVVSAYARNAPDQNLVPFPGANRFRPLHLASRSDFVAGLLKAFGRKDADSLTLTPQ